MTKQKHHANTVLPTMIMQDQLPRRGPSRRELIAGLAAAAASGPVLGRARRPIGAMAFDAFVLFDPRTIVALARDIVGDRGNALVAAASAKLFAYTWFYTSARRYAGFDMLAVDAFREAAKSQEIDLSTFELQRLVDGYSNLGIWPDVPGALDSLRHNGVRLAMLSNLAEKTLRTNLRAGRIEEYFQFVLSTDRAREFKPAPRAYDLAVRAFRTPASHIGFAASAGWDAAGASWFGYPTVWVNRSNAPAEDAHVRPSLVAAGMDGVLRLAKG